MDSGIYELFALGITMRVAFIVQQFPALSETFILNQITGLLDNGIQVDIFAYSKGQEDKVHPDVKKYNLLSRTNYFDMPVNRLRRIIYAIEILIVNSFSNKWVLLKSLNILRYKNKARSLRLFYNCLPFLNKKRYDIIHCHFGPNGNFGILAKDVGAVEGKIITTFYGHDLSALVQNTSNNPYQILFKKGDLFIAICNNFHERLLNLGCDDRKIVVHRIGIDLHKFVYSERRPLLGKQTIILTLARLVEKKGHEYAIRAIDKLLQKHENILYIIAGDGPLRSKLESLVSELGIEKHVTFIGAVDQNEYIKLYQKAHFLILPSITASNGDQEGTPVVLIEAQATGLPVVSIYHSGIPECILDGESGFLVPEKDVDALAGKIGYLIEHPELWPEMGNSGRKFVEENYDINKLNKQLDRIYQACLAG